MPHEVSTATMVLALNGVILGLVPFAISRHLSGMDKWKDQVEKRLKGLEEESMRAADCENQKQAIQTRLRDGDKLFNQVMDSLRGLDTKIEDGFRRVNAAFLILARGMVALCRDVDDEDCADVRELRDRLKKSVLWQDINGERK